MKNDHVESAPAVDDISDDLGLPKSPLRGLYYLWQHIRDEYNRLPAGDDNLLFRVISEIERLVADFTPKTIEDLAFMILFADDNGDMDVNTQQDALVALAYEMTGIKPRGAAALHG